MSPATSGASPAQVNNLLVRVREWEDQARELLRTAGAVVPKRGKPTPAQVAEVDLLLAVSRVLRDCAADARFVMDLGPAPSQLRDPLAGG